MNYISAVLDHKQLLHAEVKKVNTFFNLFASIAGPRLLPFLCSGSYNVETDLGHKIENVKKFCEMQFLVLVG